jgi:hypothetical protein
MNNLELFKEYYRKMMLIGDCDPAFPILNYICDRFELNLEQRYWIAFLYGTNYCAVTTYYIYNEFPDFENVNVDRLQRWWDKNKQKLLFQTDRKKVKSFDKFVPCYKSYKDMIGDKTQEEFFKHCKTYEDIYNLSSKIYYFGRFTLFNYIEALNELTNINTVPTFFDLKDAESSRNGLCYAFNKLKYVTLHHKKPNKPINYDELQNDFTNLLNILKQENPDLLVTIWNVETALCGFKKLFWGSRYLGYYIDRQMQEIIIMQKNIPDGVNWKPLWDFRAEFYLSCWLGENNGWQGIRKDRMQKFKTTRKHEGYFETLTYPEQYKNRVTQ